eukprot:TRINITY_DN27154_c0_g1_i1.p1 TRINITY_DN27154_c0_g1~~TRINITY_DN27154_c0_g1_i1.p1  ORF type:complete len:587 (+),score=47.74 TRINITY_DN27154_c0_g1_i1:52-1812(+)
MGRPFLQEDREEWRPSGTSPSTGHGRMQKPGIHIEVLSIQRSSTSLHRTRQAARKQKLCCQDECKVQKAPNTPHQEARRRERSHGWSLLQGDWHRLMGLRCHWLHQETQQPPLQHCHWPYGWDCTKRAPPGRPDGREYIDDITICIDADTAEELPGRSQSTVRITHDTLTKDGFRINYSKGKTEFTATLHGSGYKRARTHDIWLDGIKIDEHNTIRRTDAYKHLGTWQSFTCRSSRIAKQAADDMLTAAATLSKQVIGNPYITDKNRQFLLSIILSKALYACTTWPDLGCHLGRLRHAYHKVLRMMTGRHWKPGVKPLQEDEMRERGFPTISTQIKIRRLLRIPRMLEFCSPQLMAIIMKNRQAELEGKGDMHSWIGTMITDLRWAWEASEKLQNLPDPEGNLRQWYHIIVEHRESWKKIIKSIAVEVCGTEHDVDIVSRSQRRDDEYYCWTCDIFVKGKSGWKAHCRRKHGVLAVGRRFADGDHTCWQCGVKFQMRSRLQHLQQNWAHSSSGSCLAQLVLREVQQLESDIIEKLEEVERQRRAAARAAGRHPNHSDMPAQPTMMPQLMKIQGPLPRCCYKNEFEG